MMLKTLPKRRRIREKHCLFGCLGPPLSMAGSALSLCGSPPSPNVGQPAAGIVSALVGSNTSGLQPCESVTGAGCPTDLNQAGIYICPAETGLRERVLAQNPEKERPE